MDVDTIQATEVTVFSHKSIEYYTPREYIKLVREVMGCIDLDPASDPYPQQWIEATTYYTKEDDGLAKSWYGNVFLNPPYSKTGSKSNQEIWSTRLIEEYQRGNVRQAILLVKAALGYNWFERIFEVYPVCFTRKRIRFLTVNGPMPMAKQANAFFYLGQQVKRFAKVFAGVGRVVLPEHLDETPKHWSFYSPYAVARAIAEQHGVEWDRAFTMAWREMRAGRKIPEPAQAIDRMYRVEDLPTVTDEQFAYFEYNLRAWQLGDAAMKAAGLKQYRMEEGAQ